MQEKQDLGVRELLGRYRIVENIVADMKLNFPYKIILTGSGGLWLCGMLLDRRPHDLDVIVQVLPEPDNPKALQEADKLDLIVKNFYDWKTKYTTQELRTTGYCDIDERHKFIALPIEQVKVDVFVTGYDIECCPAKIAGMNISTPERTFIAKCGNLETRPDLAEKATKDLKRYHDLFVESMTECTRLVAEFQTAQDTLYEYADEIPTDLSFEVQGSLF